MQCPICFAEIDSNAVVCDKCGATMVVQRSAAGVIAGWLGIVMAILWGIIAIPLVVFPLVSYSLQGYPWVVFIAGVILMLGLFWYSRSTTTRSWVRSEN